MEAKEVWKLLTRDEILLLSEITEDWNVLPSSMTMKDKYDAFGIFQKLKARLVVCGNFQIDSINIENGDISNNDKESPTVSLHTVLILLSIAAKRKYKMKTFDVSGAYLNATLKEPKYMKLSKEIAKILFDKDPLHYEKFMFDGYMIVELKKALYGLREASRAWYDLLSKVLMDAGYNRSDIDPCLFVKMEEDGSNTYVLVYVDDMLVISTEDRHMDNYKNILIANFQDITECSGNNLSFIGLEICCNTNTGDITVGQSGYIKKLLDEYHIEYGLKYPGDAKFLVEEESELCDPTEFLSLCMKLMYAAIRTRADILYHCAVLASKNKEPTYRDLDKLYNILHYLYATCDYCLIYRSVGDINISCYIDASFNCHSDAKGHTGFVIFPDNIGSSGIMYKSIKQKRVADSSAEAELMALHESVKHLIYINSIYEELGYCMRGISVFQDNKATIQMSSSKMVNYKGKSKLINRKYFGVHQYVEDGSIKLVYIGTDKNVADFLTKALTGNKFLRFRIDIMGSSSDIQRGDNHDDLISDYQSV